MAKIEAQIEGRVTSTPWLLSPEHQNGFTDANRRTVEPLDVVEYRFGARRGILIEALQDGDAFVLFRDTRQVESVKWCHLCRVPEAAGPGARERRDALSALKADR